MKPEQVQLNMRVKSTKLFKSGGHAIPPGTILFLIPEPFKKSAGWYCLARAQIDWSVVGVYVPLDFVKPV